MASVRDGVYFNTTSKSIVSKIPTPLIIFFMSLQIIFGFDYGFSKIFQGKYRFLVKYTTFFASVIFILIYVSPVYFTYAKWWWWINLIKYLSIIYVLKISDHNLYDYIKEVHELGGNISDINNNWIGFMFIIYTLLWYFLKLVVFIICSSTRDAFCSDIPNTVHACIHSCFLCIIDAGPDFIIIIGFYLYCIIKNIKEKLKLEKCLVYFEKSFVMIADCYQKVHPLYKKMVLVELFINVPRLMVTLWSALRYIKQNGEWYSYTTESLFIFHLTVQICVPAVIAEMINSQIDAIKLILNEQRRVEKDKEKTEEITRILRYVKARRLQTDILRIIPVDLRLPLALLSLCTTYFIVILQFTHLYD